MCKNEYPVFLYRVCVCARACFFFASCKERVVARSDTFAMHLRPHISHSLGSFQRCFLYFPDRRKNRMAFCEIPGKPEKQEAAKGQVKPGGV